MAFKKIPLTIDTMIRNPVPVEGINQEDNVELNIVVTENKTPKDLSSQTIKVYVRRIDGTLVEQTDQITPTNASKGEVTVKLKNSAFNKEGYALFQLDVSDSIGRITSSYATFKIGKGLVSGEAIANTNEVNALKQIEEYVKRANQELETFKQTVAEINENEATRQGNEATRIEAELLREEKINRFDLKINENEKKFNSAFEIINNIIKPNSIEKKYDFSSSVSVLSEALSDVVTLESGEYFGYAEILVSDLIGYKSGNVGLRFINTISVDCLEMIAGNSKQIFKNGKIYLYGNFTVEEKGTVKAVLRYWNSGGDISFKFKVEKLYLLKDMNSKEILNVLKEKPYSEFVSLLNYKIQNQGLENGSITLEKLSQELKELIPKPSLNVIDCWGDSLMAGTGGNGVTMPLELSKLLGEGYVVNNYGQGGENAEEIAFRQGGLLAYIEPFTLKKDGSFTEGLKVTSIDGMEFKNLNAQGTYYGNGVVWIGGIKCLFRRLSSGLFKISIAESIREDIVFNKKQLLVTESFKDKNNNILLICVGQNGWKTKNPIDLCKIIKKMLEKNKNDKFLIISRPTGDFESMKNEELEFALNFGNNYFNAREYISENGLSENGLIATEEDLRAISIGAIPPQLLTDKVHGNGYFYKAYANGVYEALKNIL